MSGHSTSAAKAAAERDALPVSPMAIYEADLIERSRARAAAAGELSQACQILAAAAGRAATTDMRIAEARLLHDVARLGQPALAAPRLAALAQPAATSSPASCTPKRSDDSTAELGKAYANA
jgi:hypothetical protein